MTDAERLEYLAGQVHALTTFAAAVITSHPARGRLRAEFQRVEQMALALSESQATSEVYLDGQRATNESLSALLSMGPSG